VATVMRETERKHEPAAGGTTAPDAAGAVREPPPLTRHSSAAEVVLGYVRDQARITAHFTAELAQAGQTALAALGGHRYLRLLQDLDAVLADPPLTPLATRQAGKVLPEPVRRAARVQWAATGRQERATRRHRPPR